MRKRQTTILDVFKRSEKKVEPSTSASTREKNSEITGGGTVSYEGQQCSTSSGPRRGNALLPLLAESSSSSGKGQRSSAGENNTRTDGSGVKIDEDVIAVSGHCKKKQDSGSLPERERRRSSDVPGCYGIGGKRRSRNGSVSCSGTASTGKRRLRQDSLGGRNPVVVHEELYGRCSDEDKCSRNGFHGGQENQPSTRRRSITTIRPDETLEANGSVSGSRAGCLRKRKRSTSSPPTTKKVRRSLDNSSRRGSGAFTEADSQNDDITIEPTANGWVEEDQCAENEALSRAHICRFGSCSSGQRQLQELMDSSGARPPIEMPEKLDVRERDERVRDASVSSSATAENETLFFGHHHKRRKSGPCPASSSRRSSDGFGRSNTLSPVQVQNGSSCTNKIEALSLAGICRTGSNGKRKLRESIDASNARPPIEVHEQLDVRERCKRSRDTSVSSDATAEEETSFPGRHQKRRNSGPSPASTSRRSSDGFVRSNVRDEMLSRNGSSITNENAALSHADIHKTGSGGKRKFRESSNAVEARQTIAGTTTQSNDKLEAAECSAELLSIDINKGPTIPRLGSSRSSKVQTRIIDAFKSVGRQKGTVSASYLADGFCQDRVEPWSDAAVAEEPSVEDSVPCINSSKLCDPADPVTGVPNDRFQFEAMARKGPFQPALPEYPITIINGKNRAFRKAWYSSRDWLEYSIATDKCFCFVCRLFGKENPGKAGHSDPAFVSNGFNNWKKATQVFASHERCDFHIGCKKAFIAFITQKGVDEQLDDQQTATLKVKEQVRLANRRLIANLAQVAKMLCRGGRPFRGHDETADSQEKGLFLETVHLIAKYDDQLRQHLESGPKNATYLSYKMQNELITAIHNVMLRRIQKKLLGKKITIIADETSDCGHHEQLAVVIRYSDDDGCSQEVFVGLRRLLKTDAQSIFEELCAVLENLNLSWQQTACVCFDGANNMSGQYGGVQAKCKQQNERIQYIHCYAHCLNLVLVDAVTSRKENGIVFDFFGTIQFLYSFIEGSPTRHAVFESVVVNGGERLKALKTLSTTRWAARSEAVSAVREQFEAIVKATDEIINTSTTPEVKAKGKGLLTQLKSFNFILALLTTDNILRLINIVNRTLQGSNVSVSASLKSIDLLKTRLKDLRSESSFRDFFEEAVSMCEKMDVDVPPVRTRKTARKIDQEPISKVVFASKEEEVRLKFYYPLLDSLLDGLEERFDQESTAALRAFEKVLNLEANSEETALVADLAQVNELNLKAEMSLLTPQRKDIIGKEPNQLINWLRSTEQESMVRNFAEVVKTFSVYPVSSCKAERAFSKMAIVKMKLRSRMLQNRLNAMMLPFVEQTICNEVDIEDVVDEFNRLSNTQRKIAL